MAEKMIKVEAKAFWPEKEEPGWEMGYNLTYSQFVELQKRVLSILIAMGEEKAKAGK